MKKESILFVIDSLHCAGAEKSLTTLLLLLNYSKYDVDLQLFGYGGALEELVPKEVNILKPMEYIKFSSLSTKNAVIKSLKNMNFKMLSSRLKFSLAIRKDNYSNAQKARVYWQKVSNVIEKNNKEYDIAISYAQGVPTFYVAEKVCAKKKLAWVNVSYKLEDEDRIFQEHFYDKYNKIVAVSDSAKNIFLETFPKYTDKLEIIYDINDADFIKKMSDQGQSYNDNYTGLRILTIGRLANQKGYDMALEACKILKEKGIEFKWYSLGIGPLKEEIEKYINENNLENNFKLLGVKSNPYPFIKDCDIYVQTSRFEGFGIAIAEARMLNKPVVTTRFDAVYNQMKDRKNGLVVDMNSQGIVNGILELINNKELTNEIISYLKTEKKGNTEELEKFYKLIE
ncbi:glycosyltransferase [Clostridium sp.]|uniref:glycosyltransferase n=1 Tax=Clostridium sp. TaxID=1506 RepID=UPI0039909FE2